MNILKQLEEQAVDAAINYKWDKAIEINNELIRIDPENLGAYLRLGYIYLQSRKLNDAKKAYQKALNIQPASQIAKENLERIKILEEKKSKKTKQEKISLNPNLFLEITGKTKTAELVNLGQKDILAQLIIGQQVFLKSKKRKVEIRAKNNEYIGSLPDDLSKRLDLFIKAGTQYDVFIKEASLNRVIIFINEKKKGKKVMKFVSFPHNMQAHLPDITTVSHEDSKENEDEEEPLEIDIERLAESLMNEEKDYLPFRPTEEEDEESEE